MINLERLYYFQRIAKTGSIRNASEELYVSESALSKALRQLEQEMGCQLFQRRGKRLALNSDGTFLLDLVDALIKQAEDLKPKLDKHKEVCSQIVMDSFFDFPADILLHDVLEPYYPNVRFFWRNPIRKPSEHLRDLSSGEVDVTIIPISLNEVQCLLPMLSGKGVNSIFLLLDNLYMSAPWGTKFDKVHSMAVTDTLGERMIKPGTSNNYASVWYETILADKHISPSYHYEVDNVTFLKDWANCAHPFITTSLYISRKGFSSGFSQRHQIRLTDPEAERGIFLFYRSDHSPAIDLFCTIFKQRFYDIFSTDETAEG